MQAYHLRLTDSPPSHDHNLREPRASARAGTGPIRRSSHPREAARAEARGSFVPRSVSLSYHLSLGPAVGALCGCVLLVTAHARGTAPVRAGDEALRSVLVAGATAVIQQVRRGRGPSWPWLTALLKRKPPKLAAVALANKMARVAWKLMVSGERYNRARVCFVPPTDSIAPRARRQGRVAPPAAVACGQP